MMPTGKLMQDPNPTRIIVPTIAFAKPPPDSPTGLGICVKKSQLMAENPNATVR
jgi:hypothetical protein